MSSWPRRNAWTSIPPWWQAGCAGAFRELLEQLFFHGDPHPANLVILPNNRICFIDFGAVGRMSVQRRNVWRELQHHLRNGDIERMVACSMSLAGRLPPIDVDTVIKAMERIYTDWVYAGEQRCRMVERTTALNWFRYVNVAREKSIPVSLETIQFFRASLLYNSLVVRLDKEIRPGRGVEELYRVVGKEARQRFARTAHQRLDRPTNARPTTCRSSRSPTSPASSSSASSATFSEPIIQFRNIGRQDRLRDVGDAVGLVSMRAARRSGSGLIAQFAAERWFRRPIPGSRSSSGSPRSAGCNCCCWGSR